MHAHILHANRLAQASEPVAQGFGIGPSPLLEEACVLTKARREDLAGLPGNITDPPAHVDRRPCQPTVLDLLQRNHA